MMIYPTMELMNGRCVTLDKGRLDNPMLWHVDPVETAKGFAASGAEWMHLTDFNAVRGEDTNAGLVEEIIRSVGIPVQLGGGMRSREQIEHWIDRGDGRVTVGTLAARDPALVAELAKQHPDQIVLAVDVWQGQGNMKQERILAGGSLGKRVAQHLCLDFSSILACKCRRAERHLQTRWDLG